LDAAILGALRPGAARVWKMGGRGNLIMADMLSLVAFALPPGFPPERVPEPGHDFVRQCVPGLSREQLMARTRRRGWAPRWKRLAHFDRGDVETYDFSLTIDGIGVPLIARMRREARVGQSLTPPERDPRQLCLF
jgi:hypothetical protein